MPFLMTSSVKTLKTIANYRSIYLSLSLCLNGHFPDGSGLAGSCILLELRMMEVKVTTGAIGRAKLQ